MEMHYKKALIVAISLLIIAVFFFPFSGADSHTSNQTIFPPEEIAKYFYPKTYSIPYSLPNICFQIGNSIHVRDCETGMTKNIFNLKDNEFQILFDEKSVFTYQHEKGYDQKKQKFRKIDYDGLVEEFEINYVDFKITGEERIDYRYKISDNQLYQLVIKKTITEISPWEEEIKSVLYVDSKDGVLWEKTAEDGHEFFFGKGDLIQGLDIVYVTNASKSSEGYKEEIVAFDLLTGQELFRREGMFVMHTSWHQWKTSFLYIQPEINNIDKTEIINSKTGELLYSGDRSYYPYFLDDIIWITTASQSNWYKYDESDPIKILKIDMSGEVLEKIDFNPKTPGRSYNNCKIISENIAMMVDSRQTRFFNFRSNQQLYVYPRKINNAYIHDSLIICQDDYRLFALDKLTFDLVWELEIVESYKVDIVESDSQYLLGYKYQNINSECIERSDYPECKTLRIKAINKADMSVEPYEYRINPCIFDMDDIVFSPYGLLFIGRETLSLYRPENIKVYEVRLIGEIIEHKITDDPRYIEITYLYSKSNNEYKTVIFDVEMGTWEKKTLESSESQK